ncbi:hypothetical protein GCM10022393_13970 [Aquimarina addita]|uniref:Carboxypeptidase-like regulatory domain-containing protein n=2 Tax=Aquimarina addita TaxID=870485 RepID=A0ABP7XFM6_9FLAO
MIFFQFMWSQDLNKSKKIIGEIVHENLNLEGIHIINKSDSTFTITDARGRFSILIKKEDTLSLSGISFKTKDIVVNKEEYKRGYLKINLEETINELDEVLIKPYALNGNLLKDLNKVPYKKNLESEDFGIPGSDGITEERIVSIGESLNYGFITKIEIEPLYKHASGYYKTLKQKRFWDEENKLIREIVEYFGYDFFLNVYNINKQQVYGFVLYCLGVSKLKSQFKKNNYHLVITTFKNCLINYPINSNISK